MAKPTKAQIEARNEAIAELRELFAAEDKESRTVYVVLRSRSKSGMSRTLTLFTIRDNEPRDITHKVGLVCGWKLNKDGDLKVSGCGMDMGFHVVYTLSRFLFEPRAESAPAERNKLRHRWV